MDGNAIRAADRAACSARPSTLSERPKADHRGLRTRDAAADRAACSARPLDIEERPQGAIGRDARCAAPG